MISFDASISKFVGEMRSAWGKLAGPASFDNYVVGLFAAASIWVTLVVDLPRSNGSARDWFIAGVFSMLIGIGWLWLARAQILKIVGSNFASLIVIFIYAGAGLIRNLSLDFACLVLGLAPPTERIAISIFSTVVLLAFANITANRRRDAFELQNSLLIDRQKLIWLGASYDEKVLQAQRDLIRQLETELYPAIRKVLEKLNPTGSTKAPEISKDLVVTVSSVVRPICDRLSESTDNIIEQLDEIAGRPIEVLRPSSKFSVRLAIRPILTVGTLLFIAASISPALGKDSNFGNFALMSAIALTIAWAFRIIWPTKFDSVSTGAGLAIVSIIYAISYGVAFLFIGTFGAIEQTLLVQASFSIGGAIILARLSFSSQARKAIQQQLQEQNEKLSQLISQLRRQIWLIRRNATWVLHGPIQSALISSAMTLAKDDLNQHERIQIAERIEQAVFALQSNESLMPELKTALGSIANVWARSCAVTWQIDSELISELETDADTSTCLIEIASEGVSNAVRHGMAKSVSISFTALANSTVRIEVSDDGNGLSPNSAPGLGSAMLDQICLGWRRESSKNGTVLVAEVMRNKEFSASN